MKAKTDLNLTRPSLAKYSEAMKQFNVYDAKTNFSKLLDLVDKGEQVVIAKNGKPLYDLKPHQPAKNKIKFGFMNGELEFKDEDFMGTDPDVMEMFFGKDWDKK